MREAIGGKFCVSVELSESNPYFRIEDDGEGALDLYTELPVTQDMIDAIMEISGIENMMHQPRHLSLQVSRSFPAMFH